MNLLRCPSGQRLYSLPAICKSLLARFLPVVEFCHDCGARVDQVWTADDDLWAVISPDAGPRCISCFDARAQAAGIFLRWKPVRE